MAQTVAISAAALHIPGISDAQIPGGGEFPAVSQVDAHRVLGRKGLLAKDEATRLALCAVHRALDLPAGVRPVLPIDDRGDVTAVVVSSNYGNLGCVTDVVEGLRTVGSDGVSVLQAPNASSNIVASTVAIRFGLRGPNHMVCSGATGGLDAVELGSLLLRAGRAERVVVIGVEPGTPDAECLREPSLAAAACVILEPAVLDDPRPLLGRIRRDRMPTGDGSLPAADPQGEWHHLLGDTGGAEGVIAVAVAAQRLRLADRPGAVQTRCGSDLDGYAFLDLVARSDRTAISAPGLAS